MVAAEFKTSISTIRVHDEYCEMPVDQRISHLSHIVSASYKRRRSSNRKDDLSHEIAAANTITGVREA